MDSENIYYICGVGAIAVPALTLNALVIAITLHPRIEKGQYKWFILAEALADWLFIFVACTFHMYNQEFI